VKENDLKQRLASYHQIKLSVIGRKSGRTISILVWFVVEGEKLYLLPVQGSDTQWYKNVLKNPSIRIEARGVGAEFRATPLTDAKAVKSVTEKFREKRQESTTRNSMWRLWLNWSEPTFCQALTSPLSHLTLLASGHALPTRRADGFPLPHSPQDWRWRDGCGLRG